MIGSLVAQPFQFVVSSQTASALSANTTQAVFEISPTPITVGVTVIDQDKPTGTVELSNNDGETYTNQDVTATLKTSEPIATPDGWTRVSDTVFTKLHTENGSYSVTIIDPSGNSGEIQYTVRRIDKVSPMFTGVTNGKSYNRDVTYDVTEENLKTIIVDENSYNPMAAPRTISSEGSHVLKAIDEAGNETDLTFVIDKTAPTVKLNDIANGPHGGTTDELTMSGEVADNNPGVTISVSVNDEILPIDSSPFSYTWDISKLASGEYIVRVVARDAAGTEASQQQTVVIDNDGPVVVITSSTQDRITGTVSGNHPVRLQLTNEVDGTQHTFATPAIATLDPEVFTWSIDLPIIANGNYTVSAASIDNLGNRSAFTSENLATLLIDRVVSTPAITTLPSVLPVVSLPVARAQVSRQPSIVDTSSAPRSDEESVLNLDSGEAAEKTVPVAATEKGWTILGLAWYWWGTILGAAAIGWRGLAFLVGK